MPSASAKLEKQASQEAADPIKQVLLVIEHKRRNLEKRKTKLESYREEQKNGKELKGEQLLAVAKYDEVCKTLEFANDMAKQVQGISTEHAKTQKKQQRKEQLEKAQTDLSRIRELLIIQDVMMNMGTDSIRSDFLAGKDGATLLTADELNRLDELYPLIYPKREDITPFTQQVAASAEHLLALMEGRSKEILGSTYAELKELLRNINACGYFEKNMQKLAADFIPGQENACAVETETTIEDPAIIKKELEMTPAPVVPMQAPASMPAQPIDVIPTQHAVQVPHPAAALPTSAPAETASYFSAPVAPGAPPTTAQFAGMPQHPHTPNVMPVPQRQPQQRLITEVIPQGNFNFIQESQLDTDPPNSDLAVILQNPPGIPTTGLPPGRNPAAPAASDVPQPEFHQAISTQTFTNQSFTPMLTPTVAPVAASPTTTAAHIPVFTQQAPVAPSFLPSTAQDVPPPIPMPHRQAEQVKMMPQAQPAGINLPAPASFAQAATFNSQAHGQKPQGFAAGAPPGFGPQKMSPQQQPSIQQMSQQPQQSQFQPIPSMEQAAEQDRAEDSNTWVAEGLEGDFNSGHRGGNFRGRGGGRGRGRGNNSGGFSSGRGRGQQNGGGRPSGYQSRPYQEGGDRSYENGVSTQREYGGGNYKPRGAPRDSNGPQSRGGQGNRGGGAPFRGGASSGNRARGGSGGPGSNQQQSGRPQNVRQ